MLGKKYWREDKKKDLEYIERILKKHLQEELLRIGGDQMAPGQQKLCDAMLYSAMGSGKRIRPLLLLETYRTVSGMPPLDEIPEEIELYMAAIEMIHAYSLVHDDLPAMDDDEYRRGRKTTHIVFGEDMGILAGDALLNYAYELTSRAYLVSASVYRMAGAQMILANKAGVFGMVGGQAQDVEGTGRRMEWKDLQQIYRKKTGCLLEAAMMVGAVLGGGDAQIISAMERAGHCIGMAFQIQDDILDVVSTTEELGKNVHSDEKNEKTTYVSLFGVEKAKEAVEKYSREAMEQIDRFPDNGYLPWVVEELINRRK